MFNFSYRKVGGLRFIKLGRLTFSWSIAAAYRPVRTEQQSLSRRARTAQLARIRKYAQQYPASHWADYRDINPDYAITGEIF